MKVETEMSRIEDRSVVSAARSGDKAAFAELTERYRGQLQVHCYRLLGSYEESEDMVQETFLRAWRKRETYQERSTFRAWLYRIATNACIDAIERRPADRQVAQPAEPDGKLLPPAAIPWLQPYPDRLLDAVAPKDAEPDAIVVARETIELAFLAAIQHLPPRQRAALILRDVLGWSAKESAELLDVTVAAANSALQRARQTLKGRLPERRMEWPSAEPSETERAVLQRYMSAIEEANDDAIADVLRVDARISQQPGAGGNESGEAAFIHGRDAIIEAWAPALHGPYDMSMRLLPTTANRQPAAATYLKWPGVDSYQPFGLAVLTVDGDQVSDIAIFGADMFPAFGLPATL